MLNTDHLDGIGDDEPKDVLVVLVREQGGGGEGRVVPFHSPVQRHLIIILFHMSTLFSTCHK